MDDGIGVALATIQGDVKLVLAHVEHLNTDVAEVRKTVGEHSNTLGAHAVAIAKIGTAAEAAAQTNTRWRDWLLPGLALVISAAAVVVALLGG
jgi:lipid-binding SYLF domain-containing protein